MDISVARIRNKLNHQSLKKKTQLSRDIERAKLTCQTEQNRVRTLFQVLSSSTFKGFYSKATGLKQSGLDTQIVTKISRVICTRKSLFTPIFRLDIVPVVWCTVDNISELVPELTPECQLCLLIPTPSPTVHNDK